MAIKSGIPKLSDEWDGSTASLIANRLRDIDDFQSNVQRPPHLFIWFHGSPGETLTLSPSGTTVTVTGAGESLSEGFTYSGSGTGAVTVRLHARYLIMYSASFYSDTANRHVELGIVHNSTWLNMGSSHADFTSANASFVVTSQAILELDLGDTISIGARCPTNTTNITIEHFDCSIIRIYF